MYLMCYVFYHLKLQFKNRYLVLGVLVRLLVYSVSQHALHRNIVRAIRLRKQDVFIHLRLIQRSNSVSFDHFVNIWSRNIIPPVFDLTDRHALLYYT